MTDNPETGLPPGVPAGPYTVFHGNGVFPGIESYGGTIVVWGDLDDDAGIRGDTGDPDAIATMFAAAPALYRALVLALPTLRFAVEAGYEAPLREVEAALAAARPETGTAGGGEG